MNSFSASDGNSLEHAPVLNNHPVMSCDYTDEGTLVTLNISTLLQIICVIKGGTYHSR